MKRLLAAVAAALVLLAPFTGRSAAIVALQFPGLTNSSSAQLDPHGAAGPSGILAVANGPVSYYSKTGALLWTTNQSTFFGSSSAGDCKFIYDAASQRFFATAIATGGTNILVAASRNSNPASSGTNDWRTYSFPTLRNVDYPGIGIDAQALHATYFGGAPKFWMVMNKSNLLSGLTNAGTATIISNLSSVANFGLEAVTVIGSTSPGDVSYCVTRDQTSNNITLYAITNVLGTPVLFTTNIPAPPVGPMLGGCSTPGCAPQTNTANRLFHGLTVDGNAFWRDGELWFSEVVGSTNQNQRTVVRYYKLKTGGFPNGQAGLDEWGDLDGGTNTWRIQAAIGGNARGDVCLTFTQCSSNTTPTMYCSIRKAGQTNFVDLLVTNSAAPWTVSGNWADYPVVTPDPLDQTFWIANLIVTTNSTINIQWANITHDKLFYVDRGAIGVETGTRAQPFHTVRNAQTAASGPTTLIISPTNYPETPLPLRIDKNVRLENPYPSGTVHIGP